MAIIWFNVVKFQESQEVWHGINWAKNVSMAKTSTFNWLSEMMTLNHHEVGPTAFISKLVTWILRRISGEVAGVEQFDEVTDETDPDRELLRWPTSDLFAVYLFPFFE